MKMLTYCAGILFLSLALVSCKNKSKEAGIESRDKEEVPLEISQLVDASLLKGFFTADSSEIQVQAFHNLKKVDSLYSDKAFKPQWTSRKLRESLFRAIENTEGHGLIPEDYHFSFLKENLQDLNNLQAEERLLLEIKLTDAFFSLARHLSIGKVNPKSLYSIWDIENQEPDLFKAFQKAINAENPEGILNNLAPKHIVYQGLKKSLKEYRTLKESDSLGTPIEKGESIKPGDSSARLPNIAKRLQELKFLDSISEKGSYNKTIQQAIIDFQEYHGIETDGVIGNATIEALNQTATDHYRQILVNLERWRWYPRDLGKTYIIVNIPNYRLHVVEGNDTILSHKTMVGTEARKTPVFSDKIEHIVYNPTWTIPPTIKKNDVIPSASKDPSYISRRNMSVFDGSGNKLNPGEVNWGNASKYTIRQEAGSSNPLGRVKIIYPNRHMIYLHDTPSQYLFKKNSRAQSSGCVRVENALDLAAYLLDNQEKYNDAKTIEKIIASGKTTTIKVTKDVQVHHLYWTAWRENGKTRFAEDVYKLDAGVYKKLRN